MAFFPPPVAFHGVVHVYHLRSGWPPLSPGIGPRPDCQIARLPDWTDEWFGHHVGVPSATWYHYVGDYVHRPTGLFHIVRMSYTTHHFF